jgi:hypothetical protein
MFRSNCDCRAGYACHSLLHICYPGCTNNRECCEIWRDAPPENGIREDGEVTPVTPCEGECSLATGLCIYPGNPDNVLGGPCEHASQCPWESTCYSEYDVPGLVGGACLREHCNLEGRECDDTSGCARIGYLGRDLYACVTPCRVGTEPGDRAFTCRPEMACYPTPGFLEPPVALPEADGYCWIGVWNDVGEDMLYQECTEDIQCYSPHGLGFCLTGAGDRGYCSVFGCRHPEIEDECGRGPDGTCYSDEVPICVRSCVPPGSGCPAGSDCILVEGTEPHWACIPLW